MSHKITFKDTQADSDIPSPLDPSTAPLLAGVFAAWNRGGDPDLIAYVDGLGPDQRQQLKQEIAAAILDSTIRDFTDWLRGIP